MAGVVPLRGQPNNIYFRFEIGGRVLTIENKDTPISMDVNMKIGGFHDFQVVLLDDTGCDVEPYIWSSMAGGGIGGIPLGSLEWGYTAHIPEASKRYQIQISKYRPIIGRNLFMMQIQGNITYAMSHMRSSTLKGTLEECLDQYCARHNLDLDKDELMPMLVTDPTGETTQYREQVHVKQVNETDVGFIKRIVDQFARLPSGEGRFFIEHVTGTGGGRDVLRVKNPQTLEVVRWYVVQEQDSVVYEWAPDLEFQPYVAMQGGQLVTTGTQMITGHETMQYLNDTTAEAYQPYIGPKVFTQQMDVLSTFPFQTVMDTMDQVAELNAIRQMAEASAQPQPSQAYAINSFLDQNIAKNKATLVVLGDPLLEPGYKVHVHFKMPSSVHKNLPNEGVHYTSGFYLMETVQHSITASGQYLTTLGLVRSHHPDNPGFDCPR